MRLLLLAAFALLGVATAPAAVGRAPVETRALWVVRTTMSSPAAVRAMVASARAGGFNTLFVQVRGRGDAYYDSRLEPRSRSLDQGPRSFDPLAQVLEEAHAAGLSVHAWISVNLVADVSDVPASAQHVVRKHPEWLMVPRELVPKSGHADPREPRFLPRLVSWTKGQSGRVEGLFTSPLIDAAAAHVVAVIGDLVSRYAVNGVHLDYVRLPGNQFDYSRAAMAAFAAEVTRTLPKDARADLGRRARSNPLVYVDLYPNTWQDFRRDRVTALVRRIRAEVAMKRPGTLLSAAVVPDIATARESRAQDWPAWLAEGLIHAGCPMAYTTDTDVFLRQLTAARAAAKGRLLFAGIGAYRLPLSQTVRHIELARQAGADGVALFSYDSLVGPDRNGDTLSQIGREAFGREPERPSR